MIINDEINIKASAGPELLSVLLSRKPQMIHLLLDFDRKPLYCLTVLLYLHLNKTKNRNYYKCHTSPF